MILKLFAALTIASALAIFTTPASALHLVHRADPSPSPSPTPTPTARPTGPNDVPDLYVRGQALSFGDGFFVFTTGDAIHLHAGTILPKGLSIGSVVRVTLDQIGRDVTAIELDPHQNLSDEIDVATLPRQYVVVSEKSAPKPLPSGMTLAAAAASSGLVNVTIVVRVPANTPTSDDVYLSTDRSNYSPAEIRMQRLDARTFSISLGLPANTIVKYQFTRGTYQTVERDRSGGIVPPHQLPIVPNAKSDDSVARWADIS